MDKKLKNQLIISVSITIIGGVITELTNSQTYLNGFLIGTTATALGFIVRN